MLFVISLHELLGIESQPILDCIAISDHRICLLWNRCEFDAMQIAKALSNLIVRDRLMSDPPEEVYPSTDLFKLPSPCGSRHQPVPYRAKQCNGRGHLQLRTSNKENIQSVAKLSLSFADLLRSKR